MHEEGKYSFRCIWYILYFSWAVAGSLHNYWSEIKKNLKINKRKCIINNNTKKQIDTFLYDFKVDSHWLWNFTPTMCDFKCLICMREYRLNLKHKRLNFYFCINVITTSLMCVCLHVVALKHICFFESNWRAVVLLTVVQVNQETSWYSLKYIGTFCRSLIVI